MKTINRKYIEAFVNYGKLNEMKKSNFFIFITGSAFLGWIPIVYGFVLQRPIVYVSVSVTLVCILLSLVIHKNTLTGRLWVFSFFSLSGTCNMAVMSVILLQMETDYSWVSYLILIFPIVTTGIFYFLVKMWIKKGLYYINKNTSLQSIMYSAIISGTLGMVLARAFLWNTPQSVAKIIAFVSCLLFTAILSVGTMNFLKLHYIKKYAISQESIIEEQKREKKSLSVSKKVLIICALIFAGMIIAFVLIGVFMVSRE